MGSALVQEALRLIHAEFPYLSGMDGLAERMQVSKEHLIRVFHAKQGVSPGKYLETVRVEAAKLFLSQGDYPVAMVAEMVGYANGNYFCKVFRRLVGISPGEYRRRHRVPTRIQPEIEQAEKKMFL